MGMSFFGAPLSWGGGPVEDKGYPPFEASPHLKTLWHARDFLSSMFVMHGLTLADVISSLCESARGGEKIGHSDPSKQERYHSGRSWNHRKHVTTGTRRT